MGQAISPHESARMGADWLSSLLQPDGSLVGDTSINEYYKAVLGLALAGRVVDADRMLNYVVARYLQSDGNIDGTGCRWYHQFGIYPHAWLLMGAVVRSRFDLIHRLANYLETFQDPATGGFYSSTEQRAIRGEQDFMTTGVVAMSLLWAGRLESAIRAGGWIRRVWESQPDVRRGLYFVVHHKAGLMTDFPADKAVQYWIDASKTGQWYFQYGIGAGLSAGLYGATLDRNWIELGKAYLQAAEHCREDVYRQGASGKIGWGAAWLYQVSPDPTILSPLKSVADNLRAAQDEAGWWCLGNIYDRNAVAQPAPGIDVTGEFVALMAWMNSALIANPTER